MLALVLLALVTWIGYLVWSDNIERLRNDALKVNLAGRQRMLVERVGTVTNALAYVTDPAERQRLRAQLIDTVGQLEHARRLLLNDFGELSAPLAELYFNPPNAANGWLDDYIESIQALLLLPDSAAIQLDPNFLFIQQNLVVMVDRLDRVATHYQRENEQDLLHSIHFDSLIRGITLLMLLATGFFIFRPMEKQIAKDRVVELRAANEALSASQQELQLRYDNAPDMLLSLDPSTQTITRCNATAATRLGYAKDELIGMSRADLYTPACRDRATEAFENFLANGRVDDVELQVACKDGTLIDVSLSATAFRDPAGNITYSDAVWRDITRRKEAEAKIDKRTRQLTTLYLLGEQMLLSKELGPLMHNTAFCVFDTLPVKRVVICELCADGKNLTIRAAIGIPQNMVGAQSFSIDQRSLAGRALVSDRPVHLSGKASPSWLDGMDYLRDTGATNGIASLIKGSEGPFGLIMAFNDASNVFNQDEVDYIQSLSNLLGVAADRIRSEQRLHMLQQDLSVGTRDSALGELETSLSHELNQPLAAIMNYGQICRRMLAAPDNMPAQVQGKPVDVAYLVDRILGETERASDIIKHMQEYVELGDAYETELDINELIIDAVDLLKMSTYAASVTIESTLDSQLPKIKADRIQIQQLLFNLLRRAMEGAAKSGRGQLKVSTRVNDKQMVEVIIDSSGTNCYDDFLEPQEYIPFSDKQEGIGVDMSVCRSILEAHGGEAWQSSSNRGVAIHIALLLEGKAYVRRGDGLCC